MVQEWTEDDNEIYSLFEEYVNALNTNTLNEFSIPKILKDKIDFIKEFATMASFKFLDLVNLFLDKYVFKFFQLIGWSLQYLFDILKKGYKAYKDLEKAIHQFIGKSKIVKWSDKKLKELDLFLQKHPIAKKIGGVVLAGLLLFCWFRMTFTGDFLEDFNISSVFLALSGKYTLFDLFAGGQGVWFFTLVATGMFFGLTFPWPGSNAVKLLIAIINTFAKKLNKKVKTESFNNFLNSNKCAKNYIDEMISSAISSVTDAPPETRIKQPDEEIDNLN